MHSSKPPRPHDTINQYRSIHTNMIATNEVKFSIFPHLKKNDGLFEASLKDVYNVTKNGGKNGYIKGLIESLRPLTDKKARNEFKIQLPCICFSGVFSERKADAIVSHSGLIGLDFDDFQDDELGSFIEDVERDKYTRMAFISPSGNGLKVIVEIPKSINDHKKYFQGLYEYYVKNYIQNADVAAKDISRVCFASYDPNVYYNPESDIFTSMVDLSKKKIANNDYPTKERERANDVEALDMIAGWIDKVIAFAPGSKHDHLTNFIIRANKAGILEQVIADYYNSNYDKEKVHKITANICQSSKAISLFNTDPVWSKTTKETKIWSKTAIDTPRSEPSIVPIETFWDTPEDKKGLIKLLFSRHKLLDWLYSEGWARYHSTPNNWELVRINNNIVEKRSKSDLKKFVMEYIAGLPFSFDGIYRVQLIELVVKGSPMYFGNDGLEFLPSVEVSTHMDTFDTGWMFYTNTAVKITATKIEIVPYSEIGAYIWKSQILEREFEMEGSHKNDFCQFIMIVAGSKRYDETQNDLYNKRLTAFETSIGYLMHGYKNSALCPAVILNDAYNDGDEPRGGTGKGVFLRAIRYMRDTAMFEGKSWKQDKSFAFQVIMPSTQIAAFEDIKSNFDFEGFFSIITEGFTIEKKGKDAYKIPFEFSPKILFTTNYPIRGEGSSHERRRVELELDDFFITNPPYEYFGNRLFDDWSAEDWQCFDRYMTYCLQQFLSKSIVKLSTDNLKDRKLRELTDPVFIEWFTNWVQLGKFANSHIKDLLTAYNNDFDKYSQRRVSGWVKAFIKHYDMEAVYGCRLTISGKSVQATEIVTMGTLEVVRSGKSEKEVVKVTKDDDDDGELPF